MTPEQKAKAAMIDLARRTSGDPDEKLLMEWHDYNRARWIEKAVVHEREACAQAVEGTGCGWKAGDSNFQVAAVAFQVAAAAIRARGKQ